MTGIRPDRAMGTLAALLAAAALAGCGPGSDPRADAGEAEPHAREVQTASVASADGWTRACNEMQRRTPELEEQVEALGVC